MSNQMVMPKINLLKLPDPAAQTAKYANMMNAVRQQEAAERQAQQAQQAMNYATAEETRRKDLHGPAMTKARADNIRATVADLTEQYKLVDSDAGHQMWLQRLEKADPETAAQVKVAVPNYNPDKIFSIMLKAKEYADKLVADATSSLEIADEGGVDAQGNRIPKGTPVQVTRGLRPNTQVIRSADTPRTPVAPAAAPTPAGPVPTGKFGETRVVPDSARPLTADQQDHIRRMQEGLGMSNTPTSFNSGGMATPTAGQMSPDMVPAILDSAVETGVMAQIDLDQMLALAPPQARQGIMDVIRDNKINLQADAPSLATSGMAQQQPMAPNPVQRPQAQFADMRDPAPQSRTAGLDGAPPMQNTMAQYQPIQRKDPDMGAYPGSARVPLSRLAGETAARQRTPEQIKAQKTAELQATEDFEEVNKDARLDRKRQEVFAGERAKKDADFLEKYSDTTTKSRTGLNLLDQMIGDARLERGNLTIPKGGRRPHPGFEGVVGMGVPGVRFIPGTQAASFDALFEQIKGAAFLKAFDDLRGGGSITVTEGDKATAAMTRMNRSQSEIEFVRAAREFRDILRAGIARADKRYTALTGEAPPAAATRRKTLTKGSDGWGKAKVVGN